MCTFSAAAAVMPNILLLLITRSAACQGGAKQLANPVLTDLSLAHAK